MVAAITAISFLILALSVLGFVWWLHRLTDPIGHALKNLSFNADTRRLARILKLPKKAQKLLSKPDSDDSG